jgi:hypothetical protein
MTNVQAKRRTGSQVATEGFAALVEKLGMADAIRFVQLYDPGRGNYAEDRHQWLGALSPEEVARLMAAAELPPQSP